MCLYGDLPRPIKLCSNYWQSKTALGMDIFTSQMREKHSCLTKNKNYVRKFTLKGFVLIKKLKGAREGTKSSPHLIRRRA
jgi:hypothetical protein